MMELCLREKGRAGETGDWSLYLFMLKEAKKDLSLIYAKAEKEWFVDLLGQAIGIVSSELKTLILKEKEKEIPF